MSDASTDYSAGADAHREADQSSGLEDDLTEVGDHAPTEGAEVLDDLEAPALSDAEAERDRYLDALRRLQADFENYRKRVAKQQADLSERATETLVTKLLPVLDTADLAAAHATGDEVGQIRGALLEALSRAGLERIAPDGGSFDPNQHDAVAFEPGDGSEQEVAAVLRAGYRWNGRVLRPAMVKVKG